MQILPVTNATAPPEFRAYRNILLAAPGVSCMNPYNVSMLYRDTDAIGLYIRRSASAQTRRYCFTSRSTCVPTAAL